MADRAPRTARFIELLSSVKAPSSVKSQLRQEVESAAFIAASLALFNELDVDGNHFLDRSEVKAAFQQIMADCGSEHRLSKVDVNHVLSVFDEDRSGTISFTEFLEMHQYCYIAIAVDQSDRVLEVLSTKRRAQANSEKLEKVISRSALGEAEKQAVRDHINSADFRMEMMLEFDRLDEDKNGHLDENELAVALSNVGRKAHVEITQHSVQLAMNEFDTDGDRVISRGEFIEMAKLMYVSKECKTTTFLSSRYSASSATGRNFELAHKAVDALAAVLSAKTDAEREHVKHTAKIGALAIGSIIGVAIGFLVARRR